jgi:hypothetical protein
MTILDSWIETEYYPGLDPMGITFLVVGVICFFLTLKISKRPDILTLMTLVLIPLGLFFITVEERVDTTFYQVLIDEDTDIAEFREKYEIIEQRGITYVVKEKQG